MSNRWPGGLIRRTPVTPAGPFQNGAAPGVWTLAEAAFWTKQGLWPIAGNIQPVVEDVFSTWLYTGNGSTQTITNGINLSGQGGLVWLKTRSVVDSSQVYDTVRGATKNLSTANTNAQDDYTTALTSFTSSGFTLGAGFSANTNNVTYASWTFREAPKFFDVVTYTGTGVNRTIAHNLGSVPGCIIVKRTDTTGAWQVYHRSNANTQYMVLNTTAAVATGATRWNSTTPTSTEFTIGTDATVNASGGTYVAYLFAHDAGGFGPTLTDNIISCGSYTGNGSSTGPIVTLGWEPQWILVKRSDSSANWFTIDNMRGWSASTLAAGTSYLSPNTTSAEDSAFAPFAGLSATGFQLSTSNANLNASGGTFIYVAIRRGPMRTPTLGTSVFTPTATSTDTATTGFPVDLVWQKPLTAGWTTYDVDRLRGGGLALRLSETNAESVSFSSTWSQSNTGVLNTGLGVGSSALWSFRRAPGFFDEVCYTGTGVARTVAHNLGAVPELMIVKMRSGVSYWLVYSQTLGVNSELALQLNSAADTGGGLSYWNSTAPTSSVISLGTSPSTNSSGSTYVAYLFASVPGVSKVGSYTGNGSSQTINCAFTTGARFVLIKRTNAAGDWYVWDSARGIVAGNDPYLALNSTAAEVTTNDSVDTDSTGFIVNQVAASNINVNAATYIFLAIA